MGVGVGVSGWFWWVDSRGVFSFLYLFFTFFPSVGVFLSLSPQGFLRILPSAAITFLVFSSTCYTLSM